MVGSPLISELAVLTESGMRPGSTPSASCTTTTPGDRTPPPTEAEYDGGGSVFEGEGRGAASQENCGCLLE